MADARYVIETILRARDESADAFNSFVEKLDQFQGKSEDAQEAAGSLSDEIRKLEQESQKSGNALENHRRKVENLGKEYESTKKQIDGLDPRRLVTNLNNADLAFKRHQTNVENLRKKYEELKQAGGSGGGAGFAALRNELVKEERALENARKAVDRHRDSVKNYGTNVKELTGLEKALNKAREEGGRIQRQIARDHSTAINIEQANVRNLISYYREYENQIKKVAQARKDAAATKDPVARQRFEIEEGTALAQVEGLKRKMEGALSKVKVGVDLDAGDFVVKAGLVESIKNSIDEDVEIKIEANSSGAISQLAATRAAIQALDKDTNSFTNRLKRSFQEMTHNVAAFDNVIRGAATLLITGFLGPLVILAGIAGGALLALGSSAIFAGGALVGGLVSGIAQAIPALGLLATAASRVAGVMKAVQQQNLFNEQQSYKGAAAAKSQASANDALASAQDSAKSAAEGLRNAQENLSDAFARVRDAQKNLTEARKDAKQEIEELILAERRATLSAADAQRALRAVISSGDSGEIESARLDLDEARLRQRRATQAAAPARRGDVEGIESVIQARRQLEEARRGVIEAQQGIESARRQIVAANRGIESAKRNAAEGGQAISASAGKLAYLMAGMSVAERQLFRAMVRLQNTFQNFAKTVSVPLIESFTFAANRAVILLRDNRIINAARNLSSSMGAQFRRMFSAFTSGPALRDFLFFTNQASRNMRPLTSIVINLGRAFLSIGRAAAPALREIVDWIAKGTKEFRQFTGSARGQNQLGKFFSEGVTHLKAWVRLLGSIGNLFMAIAGPGGGARSGLGLIEGMTRGFNRFARSISTEGTKANKFFRDLFKLVDLIGEAFRPVFRSLGRELSRLFGDEAGSGGATLKAFGRVLADIIIPALFDFLRFTASAVRGLARFIEINPVIAKIAAGFLSLVASAALVAKLGSFFAPLRVILGGIASLVVKLPGAIAAIGPALRAPGAAIGLLVGRVPALSKLVDALFRGGAAASRFATPWTAIAGISLILAKRWGILGDIWDGLKDTFKILYDEIKPGIDSIIEGVQEFIVHWRKGAGALGPIKAAFMFLLDEVLKPIARIIVTVLISQLRGLARVVGGVLGGALRFVGGLIKFIARALSGDLEGALDAVKEMFGGLFQILSAPFRGFIEFLGGVVKGIGEVFKDIGGTIGGVFVDGANMAIDAINWIIGAINSIPGVPDIDPIDNIDTGRRQRRGTNGAVLQRGGGRFAEGGRVGFAFGGGVKRSVSGFVGGITDNISPKKLLDAAIEKAAEMLPNWLKGMPAAIADDIWDWLKDKVGDVAGKAGSVFDDVTGFVANAAGGHVRGRGGVDTIPALLTRGEFVVTPDGESLLEKITGVPGILEYIAGKQRPAQGYARGGRVGFAPGGRVRGRRAQNGNVDIDIDVDAVTADELGISAALELEARRMRRPVTLIRNQFRAMQNRIDDAMDNIQKRVTNAFREIVQVAQNRGDRLKGSISQTMNSVQRSVFKGMSYITKATNDSLDAFGAKPVSIKIAAPGGGEERATGGWVGNSGERGKDTVPTWLGRGEAVLNWGQQKIVNSALWNQYGATLDDVFKRTNGYHAGGPEQRGYARGGFTGPMGTGAGFGPITNFALKKFGIQMTDGIRAAGTRTSSGNVSDHTLGIAGDFSNGSSPTPEMDAFSGFWKNRAPQAVKQLIWRDIDQLSGFNIPDHMDHVHLAVWPQIAFDAARAAKIISRASRGLSISELMAGVGGALDIDHVDRLKVKGEGPLKTLVQKIMDKARKAANRFIDKQASKVGAVGGLGATPGLDGTSAQSVFDYFVKAGFTQTQAAAWVGNLIQESGLNPRADQPGGPGMGIAQWSEGERWATLLNFASARDKDPFSLKTQLDFILYELRGSESAAYSAIKNSKTLAEAVMAIATQYERAGIIGDRMGPAQAAYRRFASHAQGGFVGGVNPFAGSFAVGGEIPGGPGQAMNAIVHGGEWVINRTQQSKIAAMLGTSIDKLKAMMGFSGGPTSFAGGGDPEDAGAPKVGNFELFRRFRMREEYRHEERMERLARIREELQERLERAKKRDDEKAIENLRNRLNNLDDLDKREKDLHESRLEKMKKEDDAFNRRFERASTVGQQRIAARQGLFLSRPISPDAAGGDVSGTDRQVRLALRAIRNIRGRNLPKALERFLHNTTELTREGGLLDQMAAAIEAQAQQIQTRGALFRAGFRRRGNRLRRTQRGPLSEGIGDQLAGLNDEIEGLAEIQRSLRIFRNRNVRSLRATNRRIREIRSRGGVTDEEQEEFENLINARRQFERRIRENDTALAENLRAAYEKRQEKFAAETQRQLKVTTARLARLDFEKRMAEIMGRGPEVIAGFNQTIIKTNQEQIATLRRRLGEVRNNPTMRAELLAQIRELEISVAEMQIQMIRDSIEAVDKIAARRTAGLELRDRLAQVQQGMGDAIGAAGARAGVVSERGAVLQAQRAGLEEVLRMANLSGNRELIDELTDRIAELNVEIAENTLAQRDATLAIVQARIDAINNRAAFRGGLFGGLGQLVTTIGGVTGADQSERQRELLERQEEVLREQGGGLREALAAMGIDLRGLTGLDFVDAFQSAMGRFDEITANMTEAEKAAFESLLQGVLENENALWANTQALQEIAQIQQNPQTFSSSAWQWYRNAIFTGMGDVLPQYNIPQMHTGGYVSRSGIFELEAGEAVLTRNQQQIAEGDVNIEINEAGGPIDTTHLVNRLAFAKKHNR